MAFSPVVLFVYNRLEHTKQTIEALKRNTIAIQSDLLIFSDAAKTDTVAGAVSSVRNYIHTINGFRSITIIEQEQNKGLARSIIDGVNQLCEHHDSFIVLEDDLETSQYFLEYMNKALKRYKNERKVMQISGHMFDLDVNCSEEAFFLPFITSWGWATWKDRWQLFDENCAGYDEIKNDKAAIKRFDLDNSYPYFQMLKAQLAGKIDSWAIRWNLTVFIAGGVVLYPSKTLVRNLGFDGSGVHCGVEDSIEKLIDQNNVSSLPSSISVQEEYKGKVFDFLKFKSKKNFIDKLKIVASTLMQKFK